MLDQDECIPHRAQQVIGDHDQETLAGKKQDAANFLWANDREQVQDTRGN
jgi:hypothetical protein